MTFTRKKGGRSSSHSSRSSSTKTTKSSAPKKSTVTKRSSNGRIKRSAAARAEFMRRTGHPKGRKGYVVDHIIPLECGGADDPSKMQWQTVQKAPLPCRRRLVETLRLLLLLILALGMDAFAQVAGRILGTVVDNFVPLERLALSPQCGFSSSYSAVLSFKDRNYKLRIIVETANVVWA